MIQHWGRNTASGHLGQPLLMTDATGAEVWNTEYAPYGGALPYAESTEDPELRFPGQWADGENGLYQNWHRDYDPSLGRYIEADPLGLAAGQSLYGYVSGDPLNYIDPLGLQRDLRLDDPRLTGRHLTDAQRRNLQNATRDIRREATADAIGQLDNRRPSGSGADLAKNAIGGRVGTALSILDIFEQRRREKERQLRERAREHVIQQFEEILEICPEGHDVAHRFN